MFNRLIIMAAFTWLAGSSFAQQVTVSGKVESTTGLAVPLASIKNLSGKNKIAHADSSGNFSLQLDANAKLLVSSVGYKDTTFTLTAGNAASLVIKLSPAINELNAVAVEGNNSMTAQKNRTLSRAIAEGDLYFSQENAGVLGSRQDFSSLVQSADGKGQTLIHTYDPSARSRFVASASINEIHHKENTQGSAYFFNAWLKGIVVDTAYKMISDNGNFYNYNKMTGELVMTKDYVNGFTVNQNTVQFFILADSMQQKYTFVKVPAISPKLFCEAIAISDTYDIFKLTTTKFTKADFQTDGMTSHGNSYDEYTDKDTYYLLDVGKDVSKPFTLKKKSLLDAFGNDAKAADYISAHKSEITDDYLSSLIASIK